MTGTPAPAPSLTQLQQLIGPLFPGLMGVTLTELAATGSSRHCGCGPTCAPPAASCTGVR